MTAIPTIANSPTHRRARRGSGENRYGIAIRYTLKGECPGKNDHEVTFNVSQVHCPWRPSLSAEYKRIASSPTSWYMPMYTQRRQAASVNTPTRERSIARVRSQIVLASGFFVAIMIDRSSFRQHCPAPRQFLHGAISPAAQLAQNRLD